MGYRICWARAWLSYEITTVVALGMAVAPTASTVAQQNRPNILVIMGDDIGRENPGSYHQGLMLDATPNLNRLASIWTVATKPTRSPAMGLPPP
jgi:hypothetical protein